MPIIKNLHQNGDNHGNYKIITSNLHIKDFLKILTLFNKKMFNYINVIISCKFMPTLHYKCVLSIASNPDNIAGKKYCVP